MKIINYLLIASLISQSLLNADENFISSVQSWIGQNATSLSIGFGSIAASWAGCWYMIKKNNQKQPLTNTCNCETKITETQEKFIALDEKFNSTFVRYETDFSNWAKGCEQKIKTHIDQSTKERVETEINKFKTGLNNWQQDCNKKLQTQSDITTTIEQKIDVAHKYNQELYDQNQRNEKIINFFTNFREDLEFHTKSYHPSEEDVKEIANNVYAERQSKSIKEFQESSLVQEVIAQGYNPQHQTSLGVFADIVYNLFKKQDIQSANSAHTSNLLAEQMLKSKAYNNRIMDKSRRNAFEIAEKFKSTQRSNQS